jgi:hypothetical protein
MSRSVRWTFASLALFLVLAPLVLAKPGLPMTLKSDEPAYYLMALSLVHDRDLTCDVGDIQRLGVEFPYLATKNLILATDDGWQTALFGKPYLVSLVAAPLTALFGANGFVATNMLLFLLSIWLGALYLRQFNSDGLALLFSTGFFLLSNAFAYVFWLHTEILCLTSVTACLYLAFTPADDAPRAGRWARCALPVLERRHAAVRLRRRDRSGGLQQAVPGAARAAGVLARLAPPRHARRRDLARRRRRRRRGRLRHLDRAHRQAVGLPRPRAPRGSRSRASTACRSSRSRGRCRRRSGRRRRSSWIFSSFQLGPNFLPNVGYFLVGRHTGLLLYAPFVLLSLGLFALFSRRSRERWLLLGCLAGVALYTLTFIWFNWHGGGGFVGNRYYVVALPGFLFLVTRIAPDWLPAVGYALGGLFVGGIVLTPYGAMVPNPTLQAHTRNAPFRFFPFEHTLVNADPRLSRRPAAPAATWSAAPTSSGSSAKGSGSSAASASSSSCARRAAVAARSSTSRRASRRTASSLALDDSSRGARLRRARRRRAQSAARGARARPGQAGARRRRRRLPLLPARGRGRRIRSGTARRCSSARARRGPRRASLAPARRHGARLGGERTPRWSAPSSSIWARRASSRATSTPSTGSRCRCRSRCPRGASSASAGRVRNASGGIWRAARRRRRLLAYHWLAEDGARSSGRACARHCARDVPPGGEAERRLRGRDAAPARALPAGLRRRARAHRLVLRQVRDAGGDPLRRPGHAPARAHRERPQADGRDRRPADPLAHPQALRRARLRALRALPRLQGLGDQAVLPALPRDAARLHDRHARRPAAGRFPQPGRRGELAGDLRRDRRRLGHRRKRSSSSSATSMPRPSASPTATPSAPSISTHCSPSTAPRPHRHGDRRPSHLALRRDEGRRRQGRRVQREADRRRGRRLRRLLRLRTRVFDYLGDDPGRSSSSSRCRSWRATASSASTSTRASGTRWTPTATGCT